MTFHLHYPKIIASFFYPSIAGSFVFTDAFHINEDIIKFGKVRLSWAKVGNDAGAYYKMVHSLWDSPLTASQYYHYHLLCLTRI